MDKTDYNLLTGTGTNIDYNWPMKNLRTILDLFKETIDGWNKTRGTLLAAGLAYYTIFSISPLLVISIGVASLVFGEAVVTAMVLEQINDLAGPEVAKTIRTFLENVSREPGSDYAAIFSVLVSLIGASIMFVQLKRALNLMWGIEPQRGKNLIVTIQTQLLSVVLVVGAGLLLLVSMAFSTFLGVITQFVDFLPPNAGAILPEINFGLIWVVFTFVFAILFKLLPDAKIAWKDVWLGAAVTSILFTLGEFLIGFYLGRINLGVAFGTASSIILILVWVYYSMQIILFGAKFTHVYANKYGSGIEASSIAELVVSQPINDLLKSKQDGKASNEETTLDAET